MPVTLFEAIICDGVDNYRGLQFDYSIISSSWSLILHSRENLIVFQIAGKLYHNWQGRDLTRWITVNRRGTYVVLQTFFGLEVAYDGNHLRVKVPSKFSGKVSRGVTRFNNSRPPSLPMISQSIRHTAIFGGFFKFLLVSVRGESRVKPG